jgi:hypothetical protein
MNLLAIFQGGWIGDAETRKNTLLWAKFLGIFGIFIGKGTLDGKKEKKIYSTLCLLIQTNIFFSMNFSQNWLFFEMTNLDKKIQVWEKCKKDKGNN